METVVLSILIPDMQMLTFACRKHGTFRPALLGLVQSNTSQAVEETTKKAYNALLNGTFSKPNTTNALKILVGLKGIGPATSSLLLSVLQPGEVPFFSDELFRWCCWDNEVKGKEGAGWERKIKYNFKEYEAMFDEVERLKLRFKNSGKEVDTNVRAADIEKVAWVLGKEGRDLGAGEGKEKQDDDDKEPVKEEETKEMKSDNAEGEDGKATQPPVKKGTKRKAAPTKTPIEGTRKSMRTKK